MQRRDNTDEFTRVKKTRKKHRNSKHGCTNCKRRQIKCDEYLPICGNCQRRDDACSYLFMRADDFQRLMRVKNEEEKYRYEDIKQHDYQNIEKITQKKKTQQQNPFGIVNTAAVNELTYDSGFDVSEDKLKETFGNIEKNNPAFQALKFSGSSSESVVNAHLIGQSVNAMYMYGGKLLKKFDGDEPIKARESGNEEDELYSSDYTDDEEEEQKQKQEEGREFSASEDDEGSQENVVNSVLFNCIANEDVVGPPSFTSQSCGILPDQPYVQYPSSFNSINPPEITSGSIKEYFGKPTLIPYNSLESQASFFDLLAFKDTLTNKDDYTLKRPGYYTNKKSRSLSLIKLKEEANDLLYNIDRAFDIDDIYNDDGLTNARVVNANFKLHSTSELDWLDPLLIKLMSYLNAFEKHGRDAFYQQFQQFDIDRFFDKVYKVQINFALLFSKLISKSMILFIADVVKNILCKQKTILPTLDENGRVAICRACEQYSVELLPELTSLINNEYISRYSQFGEGPREILLDGFIRLASCTIYHYNSGYRQSISVQQSKECTKYIGTFTAGMFSIVISENDKAEQTETFKTYSKHLLLWAKYIIIPNYNFEILNEISLKLNELKLNNISEFSKKSWASCYINLNIFLEKNSQFLKVFRESGSLLGYDRAYIIRMVNEWYQIFPYDLVNIVQYKIESQDDEIRAILYLTFLGLRYCLEAIIPGVRSLVRNAFVGGDKLNTYGILNLINVYRTLRDKNFKIYAIYIIRLTSFFVLRYDRAHAILSKLYIPEFSSSKEMTPDERCKSLIKNWKFGNVITEIQKASLSLKDGLYIEEYNYISIEKGQTTDMKDDNKIKFRSKQELIADFEKTNSGFLSRDFDPRKNSKSILSASKELSDFSVFANKVFTKHFVAYNSDNEVNSQTMRNCWVIENYIKTGG